MSRKHKPIDGVISDVSEPVRHAAGGYRVRFRQNGVQTEKYRTDTEQAQALFNELKAREEAAKAKIALVATSLRPSQVKQAELAFQILANSNVVDLTDESTFERLPFAAAKLCEALAAQGSPITVGDAYRLFLVKQEKKKIGAKTLKDYRYFFKQFLAQVGEQTRLADISAAHCQSFIYGLPSGAGQFKSYGYLAAFFAFCKGKHNTHIGTKDKPWIAVSPLNMERPALKINKIVSYTFGEIKNLLNAAKETNSLGYVVFRLFSLARYDETERFITKGGSDYAKNPFIDLDNNRIHFDSEVYLKRGKAKHRGRYVTIHSTFKAWILYFIKNNIWFAYNRYNEETARRSIGHKFGDGFDNLLRHTAITMHLKRFGDVMQTATEAGTSPQIIQDHYYNVNLPKRDATDFYKLTPQALGWA